ARARVHAIAVRRDFDRHLVVVDDVPAPAVPAGTRRWIVERLEQAKVRIALERTHELPFVESMHLEHGLAPPREPPQWIQPAIRHAREHLAAKRLVRRRDEMERRDAARR